MIEMHSSNVSCGKDRGEQEATGKGSSFTLAGGRLEDLTPKSTYPEVDILPLERLNRRHEVGASHAVPGQGQQAGLQLQRRDGAALAPVH